MKLISSAGIYALVTVFMLSLGAETTSAEHLQAEALAIAERAEKLSDRFEERFEDELDRSLIDGTDREDRLEDRADQLENALDRVRSAVRRGKPDKARQELDHALTIAHDINRGMDEFRMRHGVEQEWRQLRDDLNALAAIYDLPPLDAPLPADPKQAP